MNTTAARNTEAFKYRIVSVTDLQTGDIIKGGGRIVHSVSVGTSVTAVTFRGARAATFPNSDKVGVYRRTPAYLFAR